MGFNFGRSGGGSGVAVTSVVAQSSAAVAGSTPSAPAALVTVDTAGGTYTAAEQTMLAHIKTDLGVLRTALAAAITSDGQLRTTVGALVTDVGNSRTFEVALKTSLHNANVIG